MASVAEDIRDYLIAQGQSDVLIGALQDSPDAQAAVVSTGGARPEVAMGATLVRRHVFFQVIVRGSADGKQTVMNRIDTILGLLSPKQQITSNSVVYDWIVAVDDPFFIGHDDSQRPMWSANFEAFRS